MGLSIVFSWNLLLCHEIPLFGTHLYVRFFMHHTWSPFSCVWAVMHTLEGNISKQTQFQKLYGNKSYFSFRPFALLLGFVFVCFCASAKETKLLIVAQTGKADFQTVQAAINSLPDSATEDRVIFIKNGTYAEKVFISKNHIVLKGESKEKTIITQAIARDAWRCSNPDDWGVATLNLKGSDITLQNLTISNTYGFDWKADVVIPCPNDAGNPQKTIGKNGHQMALRSFSTTRLKVINCNLKAWAGDTVSPWNTTDGMFYFKDCNMEGGVDFYCPRGWAYAENCTFYANTGDAAIWHDGSGNKDAKTVLKNCSFSGYDGFKLGRYHKEAQFYLIGCTFANNMADEKIYHAKSGGELQWGERIYFYNCHKNDGKDFAWFKDNLSSAEGAPKAEDITADWVFNRKWQPVAGTKITTNAQTGSNQGIKDAAAENMLMFQRNNGGWNKHLHEKAVDYGKTYTSEQQIEIKGLAKNLDATIDNEATTKEIKYLVKTYIVTKNPAYLQAAERGIAYLLSAQYANGGWPQYYPDFSSYRSQITFNDNAMVNVLNLLQDITEGENGFNVVDKAFILKAQKAIQKGINCILATQLKDKGKLTAWCTQYNAKTLQPEMARKFELASLSAAESVGIVRFLMHQPNPTPAMKLAIAAAVKWMDAVKITGHNFISVKDSTMPRGFDKKYVEDANSTIWARFYEIGTNRPLFAGRDSEKKFDVAEVEPERRTGYAWYGIWPAKLLEKEYPEWKRKYKL